MAMQGAIPIRINPYMYSGYSLRKRTDKQNIRNGPMIQVINIDKEKSFRLLKSAGIFSNRTFVNGGYIIKISPKANGILVVPDENELMKSGIEGMK
jgi:hypothetical protein